jgi:hypothetical protein
MNPRREVEFAVGEATYMSRPTMARVAAIEAKFGPLAGLLTKMDLGQLSITGHILPILAIMLNGAEGLPVKGEKPIAEWLWENAAVQALQPSLIEWVVAAYTTNEPAERKADAGN